MSLMDEFQEFEDGIDKQVIPARTDKVDYKAYIEALNVYATKCLGLLPGEYVLLKPVYLHGTKIHSLVFNVCKNGRRYSARLKKRLSLGMRDREGSKWLSSLNEAYEIALNLPAVGLDPKLEELSYWHHSNKNHLKMTFKDGNGSVTIGPRGVLEATGDRVDVLSILYKLKERGL